MTKKITLEDMQKQSGLTKRTLHSYIQKGLLPGPEKGGRYAHYSKDHLSLLKLITRLKDLNLPLSKIRELSKNLSPQQIRWLNEEEFIKSIDIPHFSGEHTDFEEENKRSINYIVKLEIVYEMYDKISDHKQLFADKSENLFSDESNIFTDSNIEKYSKEIWHRIISNDGLEVKIKIKDEKKLDEQILLRIFSFIKELLNSKDKQYDE